MLTKTRKILPMHLKKLIVQLCALPILLSLTGCGWKKIGEVDMSKLVSLEEVWNNKDNYIGKVITVEMDTVITSSKGLLFLPTGEQYAVAAHQLNNRYLRTQEQYTQLWEAYIDSVGGVDSARGDTIFTGDYDVGFVIDKERPPEWPRWIKNTPEALWLNTYGDDWERLEKKPKKYLCGVLLGCTHLPSRIDWIPKYDSINIYKDYREIIIMPLGYKYKKQPEIPLLRKYE